jgi:hypothetical protein
MEKEEKLDEILRTETSKIQANIFNLYKSARVLLNKSIEEGQGKAHSLQDGNAEYVVIKDAGEYRFKLAYNNFNFSHLKVYSGRAFHGQNEFGGESRGYKELALVLDVKEISDKLYINKYVPSEEGDYSVGEWEKTLLGEAQKVYQKQAPNANSNSGSRFPFITKRYETT